jgi:hypothetical protein
MSIFNNACVQDLIAFDATIGPSSIRSEATGEVSPPVPSTYVNILLRATNHPLWEFGVRAPGKR